MPSGNEYTVQSAGFRKVDVVISPDDYRGLSPENLRRAEQMIRETEIIPGQLHQMRHRDFGRPIGFTSCLRVKPGDTVLYAKLKGVGGRNVWGRFVFFRQPEATSHLFINLKSVCGQWRLIRVYLGEHAPAFPGDPNEAPISREFWSQHALLWDTIPTDRNTQPVVECPWPELPQRRPSLGRRR